MCRDSESLTIYEAALFFGILGVESFNKSSGSQNTLSPVVGRFKVGPSKRFSLGLRKVGCAIEHKGVSLVRTYVGRLCRNPMHLATLNSKTRLQSGRSLASTRLSRSRSWTHFHRHLTRYRGRLSISRRGTVIRICAPVHDKGVESHLILHSSTTPAIGRSQDSIANSGEKELF
jgi:hypothetical protein